jgi:hypothetical protein
MVAAEAKRSDQQRTLTEQHNVWALHSIRTVGCAAAAGVREGTVGMAELRWAVASAEQHAFVIETPQGSIVLRCLVQLQSRICQNIPGNQVVIGLFVYLRTQSRYSRGSPTPDRFHHPVP